MATMGTDEEYTRLADLSVDDGSNAIHEGSHGSIIRVIFYVCIALMVIIAVVFGIVTVRERNRRKRRRRRINTDEWYK
jgi:ribosomal protein S26